MPAFDLSHEPQPIARYDVVGQHATGSLRFVKHVALFVVDGMRPDGLQNADTPTMDGLIAGDVFLHDERMRYTIRLY